MFDLVQYVWNLGPVLLVVPPIIFILLFLYIRSRLGDERDRELYSGFLRNDSARRFYRRHLKKALKWIDGALVPDNDIDKPQPTKGRLARFSWWSDIQEPTPASARKRALEPFGWPLLDWCLGFAFAYPVLLMIVISVLLGRSADLGGLQILSDGYSWQKAALLAGLTMALSSRIPFGTTRLRTALFVAGAGLCFAGAVAVAGAFAGAFAAAAAVAFAAAAAAAGAVAGAIAVAGAVASAFAVAVAGAFAVAAAVAFAAAAAVAFAAAAAAAVGWSVRRSKALPGYGLLIGLATTGFFASVWLSPSENIVVVIVFLGILPLSNGVLDYLSIGLTRKLLKAGVATPGRALLLGGVDLLAAFFSFIALGLVIITAVAGANALRGEIVINVDQVLSEMGQPKTWSQHLWIYLMLFSTLVPTLLHFSLALFSVLATIPGRFRRSMRQAMVVASQHKTGLDAASAWIAFLGTLAFTIVFYGFWLIQWVVNNHLGTIGNLYLRLFRSYAEWIQSILY